MPQRSIVRKRKKAQRTKKLAEWREKQQDSAGETQANKAQPKKAAKKAPAKKTEPKKAAKKAPAKKAQPKKDGEKKD